MLVASHSLLNPHPGLAAVSTVLFSLLWESSPAPWMELEGSSIVLKAKVYCSLDAPYLRGSCSPYIIRLQAERGPWWLSESIFWRNKECQLIFFCLFPGSSPCPESGHSPGGHEHSRNSPSSCSHRQPHISWNSLKSSYWPSCVQLAPGSSTWYLLSGSGFGLCSDSYYGSSLCSQIVVSSPYESLMMPDFFLFSFLSFPGSSWPFIHSFFMATPAAYGRSWARSQIRATATSLHRNTASESHLQPTPQLWQHQILNPLSEARDRTHTLMDTVTHWAMTGTPWVFFNSLFIEDKDIRLEVIGRNNSDLICSFSPSDSPAPEASALSQEENPRNQLMALMLLTAQPQVRFASSFLLKALTALPNCSWSIPFLILVLGYPGSSCL